MSKNDQTEYSIGKAYVDVFYILSYIPYILVGGLIGLITNGWSGAAIGAIVCVVIRFIVITVKWAIIRLLVNASNNAQPGPRAKGYNPNEEIVIDERKLYEGRDENDN